MQNLKIRVNNEAESKEAQELFFEIGYGFEGNKVKETQEFEYTGVFYLFAYGDDCDLTYSTDRELFNSKLLHKEITLTELRAMVNHDQDDPFLTPETTLNDKYTEIERVRQHKSSAWDTQVGGSHYKQFKIQPMQFALENKLDAAQQNVIKYIMRHSFKNGKQDLEKAKHYIDLMIEFYYGGGNNE